MIFYFKIQIFITIISQIFAQAGRKLGDECIPGMCSAVNSNCKWNGNLFKCVCKEKFLAVNQTHCGHPISNIEEHKCRDCLERDSLCLDFNNDGATDECWCPKNESCGKTNSKNNKALKNVDISMVIIDSVNNRPILEGNSLFLGDQVIFDIKTTKKDLGVSLGIENCSISALSNSEDVFVEKIDLVKRGCPVQNELSISTLNFHSLNDLHLESNVFEVFKLKSSSSVLINCWVQICSKKCAPRTCPETNSKIDNSNENFILKEVSLKVVVDDPYGIQQSGTSQTKNNGLLPNVIELEIKTKPFSGLVKSIIVSVVTIIFGVVISVASILIYRACIRDQMLNSSRSEEPESICPQSESCKYEMNARHLDESFMQNPIEPITNQQQNNPRW